ncbi:hypothetical protein GE061_010269 [Apolygus lucorum]|uniref:FZ domain-containing protein n=1 Tax=Apolygus lucorum TaxID=248454 RepID=A0A8S9Y3U5_APOLU|nr:hypothetical protein GE061_010269 [Apolygus lucorum]
MSLTAGCWGYKRGPELPHHGRCEPITVPFCKEIPYNDTIMPNLLNHAKQEDAGLDIQLHQSRIEIDAAKTLQINQLTFETCYEKFVEE